MFGPAPAYMQPYFDVIEGCLAVRDPESGCWDRDSEFGVVRFAVDVAKRLADEIQKKEGCVVPLKAIIDVETSASGHVDYVRKFALGVFQLAVPDVDEQARRIRKSFAQASLPGR